MQKILVAVITSTVVVAMLSAYGTLPALATPSPGVPGSGMTPPPGQNPNQGSPTQGNGAHPGASDTATSVNCGQTANALNTPGNSGSQGAHSPNFPYNQGSPGQPAGAQYDVSCFQHTSNPGHSGP